MRIILFLIAYCSAVYGSCDFHGDNHTTPLQEKMEKWGVYQNYAISRNGITYLVGICVSPDNTTAAIIQKEKNSSIVLGRLNDVNLIGEDNWILLTFENGDIYNNVCDNLTRTASIILLCGSAKNNLTILQEHTENERHCNYMFKLQVPQMCPSPTPEKPKKLSGGAIFLIILFSVATAYFILGGIYMHVRRGARGLDRIPNLEMWRRLGNYAADGCDFCCRCDRSPSRAGYFLDESGPDIHGNDDDILSP